jgi:anaphase-promoting complex subunit 10
MMMLRAGEFLKAFCLQLAVLSNHQNGRDTHIRQIKVFGPRRDPLRAIGFPLNFTDEKFHAYATIR